MAVDKLAKRFEGLDNTTNYPFVVNFFSWFNWVDGVTDLAVDVNLVNRGSNFCKMSFGH